jgi:hypothetical protein
MRIGIVTNEVQEILLDDCKNERPNEFADSHPPDLCLHGEFTHDFLMDR